MSVNRLAGWADVAHPVWMCGMRPFFLLSALSAVTLMLPWLSFLAFNLPPPAAAGGPFAWHAHELLYGFALATVAGFLLTAVPEFTATPDFSPRVVRRLVGLWFGARLAFWGSGVGGAPFVLLSGLLHVALIVALGCLVAPRVWDDPRRTHGSFLWALGALAACEFGFHLALLIGSPAPTRWLHAAVGVYMILIVIALSRISMRVVNQALLDAGLSADYLARPPRRNLAIACIACYTVAEFALRESRLTGWLALAAAAAVFHLLNDWHVGRPLLRRRPLMLYGIYVSMGLGYALMGCAALGAFGTVSAGRHLLTVGALGLAVLAVTSIAGRAHCGLRPDERIWIPIGAAGLLLAAGLRAVGTWALPTPIPAWTLAGTLWCLVFALYLLRMAPILLTARSDGFGGCHGVASE